jgi:hypothetical protein
MAGCVPQAAARSAPRLCRLLARLLWNHLNCYARPSRARGSRPESRKYRQRPEAERDRLKSIYLQMRAWDL